MARRLDRYKGKERLSFICSARNKGRGCSRHDITEEVLRETVLACLRIQAEVLTDWERLSAYMNGLEVKFEDIRTLEGEAARLAKVQEQCLSLQDSLWEDLKDGTISREDFRVFRQIYEDKYARAGKAIAGQEEWIRRCMEAGAAAGRELEHFKEVQELTELNRDVLMTFVRRIEVYEDKRIRVEFNMKGIG